MKEGVVRRCPWAGTDPAMIAYHDSEWGVPCHDDGALFERLMLESFQAGLSWSTILRKRAAFYEAFEGWNPVRLGAYGPDDVARLLGDIRIVRNRAKIAAAISNARAFLATQAEYGEFERYLWSFASQPDARARPVTPADVPVTTSESEALSQDLRRRGFRFVGPTICYALMQSVGMVDDHLVGCVCATE